MKRIVCFSILVLVLSGCVTTKSFTRSIQQNKNLTASEAEQKLGKPYKTVTLAPNIYYGLYKTYSAIIKRKTYAVYFVDGNINSYDYDTPFFHLDTQYKLGLINKDEYQRRYLIAQQEEYARQIQVAQEDALAMQGEITKAEYLDSKLKNKQVYQESGTQEVKIK